jgi:hypothetical protein
MSTRRAVALAQLLGLHILDRPPPYAAKFLPESRDFAEKEERRRTFWSVFCNERWTSSGTGNPTAISEEDVTVALLLRNIPLTIATDPHRLAVLG